MTWQQQPKHAKKASSCGLWTTILTDIMILWKDTRSPQHATFMLLGRWCIHPCRQGATMFFVWLRRFWGCCSECTLILIWPWVFPLLLFIGPWLCFCAEETPAESWLPADRPDSWSYGRATGFPTKTTGPTALRKSVQILSTPGVVLSPAVYLYDENIWNTCIYLIYL